LIVDSSLVSVEMLEIALRWFWPCNLVWHVKVYTNLEYFVKIHWFDCITDLVCLGVVDINLSKVHLQLVKPWRSYWEREVKVWIKVELLPTY